MSNVQLEGLVWSVVSVSFGSPAFHLVSGGDVNRTIYKAGEQNPWQSLKPQPPLLVSWASRESLCNWQCLLEQWSNTKKLPETADLTFPKVRAEHKRDGMVLKFHDSNVDRSDVLPWSPSPRANFLGKKSAFEVVDPENVSQTAMAATGCCVRCLGNDGVLLGFGSGEGSLVKSHRSFRFIMKHYQTWLIEFHDLIHACRSFKVLPINSFLNMFKHANACQCRLKDVAGLSITWTRFSRCGCELPTRSWDSDGSLKRTWHQALVIWVGTCRLQNPRSRNLESKPTQGNRCLNRLIDNFQPSKRAEPSGMAKRLKSKATGTSESFIGENEHRNTASRYSLT